MASLTGNSRQREQRLQSLLLDRLMARYDRKIASEISRAMKDAAVKVEQGKPARDVFNDHKNRMSRIMIAMYEESIERFADYFSNTDKARRFVLEQKREVPKTQIIAEMIANWIKEYGGQLITEITETTMAQINEVVADGINEGIGEREIAKRIKEVAPVKSASRAQTIARTETHRAANATGIETAKATGLEMKKVWVASGGGRTRDTHRDADSDYSEGIALDDVFVVGGDRLRYPGDPSGSPEETINCLIPDTRVYGTDPEKLTRSHYEGFVYRIETANGNQITVTPNHPILTRGGWVKASSIKHGDDVISASFGKSFSAAKLDIQNIAPTVEQVFNSAFHSGTVMRVNGCGLQFHGEDRVNKNIDVVFVDWGLRNRIKSQVFNPLGKLGLPETDLALGVELASSLTSKPFFSGFRFSSSFISFFNLIKPLSLSHLRPFEFFGLAPISRFDPVLDKPSGNTSSINANFFADTINRKPIVKQVYHGGCEFINDRVTSHKKSYYSGYVYNIDDAKGAYIGNNIVTHNCRCVLVYEFV